MRNSYDDAASSDVASHLFEWAVGDEESAPDVASKRTLEAASRHIALLREQDEHVRVAKDVSDLGTTLVAALEDVGFTADFELEEGGRVRVSFDDDDEVFDRRRRRVAEGIVGRITEASGARVVGVKMLEHANGGYVTVGLMQGVGFGGSSTGFDLSFDPFAQRNIRLVSEMDVNVDDHVIDRLHELTELWDDDHTIYDEAARITLRGMSADQRDALELWIEGHINRVGVPGTTLEEVLHDVHRRIGRSRG